MTTKTETYDRIMALHRQGKSQNAISQETGMNKSTVNTVINVLEANPGSTPIVPLDQIASNPWQPRKTMDPAALQRLADDIAEKGLLQTPLGRHSDGAVQLAFGHRRLAAIKLLVDRGQWELDGMPVQVKPLSDGEMFRYALSENSVREHVDPVDEMEAVQRALGTIKGLTIAQLARDLDIKRPTLSNHLRCLKLPASVLDLVRSGAMTFAGAREFLCLHNNNHSHVDQMDWVIGQIAHSISGLPDFTPQHVRQVIARLVWQKAAQWRPLDPNESRPPSFDVDKFCYRYRHLVHPLPDSTGAKTRPWTCDVKLWDELQTAATRKANEKAAVPEEIAAPAPQGNRASDNPHWVKAMQADPAVQAVLGNRVSGRTLRRLTPETAQALGSLATLVTYSDQFQHQLDLMPTFMENRDQCWQECNWGARYRARPSWQPGDPMMKCCTNQSCYDRKCAAGKDAFVDRLKQQRQDEEARAEGLISKYSQEITDDVAYKLLELVASFSKGEIYQRSPRTNDWDVDQELAYYPGYLVKKMAELDILPEPRFGPYQDEAFKSQRLLETPMTDVQQRLLAATLLVYLTGADMEGED